MLTNTAIKNTSLNRREVLLALGATAVGLAGLSGLQAAEHDGHGSSPADHCAKACADSMTSCSKHVRHCTQHLPTVTRIMRDAWKYALAASKCAAPAWTPCYGPMGVTATDACAKACDLCADECEKIASDEAMKVHAKLCRDCVTVCRDFIKARA